MILSPEIRKLLPDLLEADPTVHALHPCDCRQSGRLPPFRPQLQMSYWLR